MSAPDGNDLQLPEVSADYQQVVAARAPPTKLKGCRNVRGLPLHQRKLFRNLARQTPRVQGLTFDHNQIRWISYWKNEQNKQVQKHFPVSRYGFFGARKLALEERNRVQGWPLDTDEASAAIEKLKLDVAAYQGREDGSNPNGEDGNPLDSDDEHPNTQATESALMRSMREDDEGYDRHKATASLTRRRTTRPKAKRALNVSTQTDGRDAPVFSDRDRERSDGSVFQQALRHDRSELRGLRDTTDYADFLNRACALAAAQRAEQQPAEHQRKIQRQGHQLGELWARRFKNDELAEAFLSLTPGRNAGAIYLDGGDRHAAGGSRLVSMASTSFEEGESLGDASLTRDSMCQEPDALRDLLNCVVSEPVDTGVDWDAECALATSNIDVSRPTRNPQARNNA